MGNNFVFGNKNWLVFCPRSWQPVTDYVESKYEDYLNAESKVNRKSMTDSRVSACLARIS